MLVLDASDNGKPQVSGDSPAPDPGKEKRDIFLRLIAEHGGHCFSSAGHNAVAEFPSAVEAVRCSVDIQQAMIVENKRLPLEKRLLLRIGLHTGDVTEENGYLSATASTRPSVLKSWRYLAAFVCPARCMNKLNTTPVWQ